MKTLRRWEFNFHHSDSVWWFYPGLFAEIVLATCESMSRLLHRLASRMEQ